jgi:hypothetical protein
MVWQSLAIACCPSWWLAVMAAIVFEREVAALLQCFALVAVINRVAVHGDFERFDLLFEPRVVALQPRHVV